MSIGMDDRVVSTNCGVVGWVNTKRWYGLLKNAQGETKKVYASDVPGELDRGRPPVVCR